jgi:tripartite-type tricarboxylate transporter receptor subunit TctC
LGYGSNYLVPWYGIFAPEGVPQPILNVLIPALEKVSKNPEVVQRVTKAGFTVDYKNPEEFRKFIELEIRTVEKVARDSNLIKE